ncbi:hypothetical protein ACHHYP_10963 [Achlya hypogyna]|uniref:PX domain-containing protein n=1 Tax=Achlya hypogyna TaxID=1202772 RepID=A0A1V9YK37_ACHHY|nr:hypothetical protein ACHHYP_10963 [Achlya hypogyna]
MGCISSTTATPPTVLDKAPPRSPNVAVAIESFSTDDAPEALEILGSSSSLSLKSITSEADDVEPPLKQFVITGESVNDHGVVVYHIAIPDSPFEIRRRFDNFKQLHTELTHLAMEEDLGVEVPELPYTGLLTKLQRQHTRHLDERKEKLGNLLETAASHPVMRNSKGFQKFVTLDIE